MLRARASLTLALAFALGAIGCGFGYSVVRVREGRSHEGRFVVPEAYQASLEAALAAERGDWAGALAALAAARNADGDDADLAARMGTALCHLDREREAMKAFADALEIDPESERAFTERAMCRLRAQKPDLAAIRADLTTALAIDPEDLEPALLLVELDVREEKLARARARAEEAAVLHPTSASAWRSLAFVAARQGELTRATEAALRAKRYDSLEGKKAIAALLPLVDEAGLARAALLLRGKPAEAPPSPLEDPSCIPRLRALETIAAHGDDTAIAIAADGVRAACPEADDQATQLELASTWSPKSADAVEARAASAPAAKTRRFGARMRLRRLAHDELEDPASLPLAEDRETLALHLASRALVRTKNGANDPTALSLARAAHELAPAEPTVARMVAETLRRAGKPASDPLRVTACSLARTEVEKSACKS